jgi:ATP-dependent Lon protease
MSFSANAIESLVMPQERLDLIHALVYRYTNREAFKEISAVPWTADWIENKGKGQIFLLHGPPGVGKTYVCHVWVTSSITILQGVDKQSY